MEILIGVFVAISAFAAWFLVKRNPASDLKSLGCQEHEREYIDPRQEEFHRRAQKEVQAYQVGESLKRPAFPVIAETIHKDGGLAEAQTDKPSKPTGINLLDLLPAKFVVLDLETTGLSPSENEIIEIGAIKFAFGASVHDGFQLFLRPKREIGPKIEKLTGITQQMLDRDGVEPAVALKGFSEFICDLPLVTFNAPFDMGFLWSAGRKHGLSFKNRYTCALQLSRQAWPELPSHRLADLAGRAQLSDENTHRALADSKRALQIFLAAVTTLGSRVQWERQPIDWHVMVEYNKAKESNRAVCEGIRPLEECSTEEAVRLYLEAMGRMYEYEAIADGRYADAYIIDRLSLCLWKSARYRELVEGVDTFVATFPEVKSNVMTAVLRRRERAAQKAGMQAS